MDRRDVWLPSDRWREKPIWGHVTICLPSYISLPTQMDGEIWRYTGKQKLICSSCRVSFQTIKTFFLSYHHVMMWVLWPHRRYWWKLWLDQVAKTFLENSEYLELFGNVWHETIWNNFISCFFSKICSSLPTSLSRKSNVIVQSKVENDWTQPT